MRRIGRLRHVLRASRGASVMGLSSALIVLLLLEASLRVLGPILPGAYRTGPLIQPDPLLGWIHVRDRAIWVKRPEYAVRVEFNAQGRRGPLMERQKSAGTRRVLMLGDSFVEGLQVAPELTLAGLLERQLGPSAQVVNDGVGGYGTDQEVLLLETEADLAPDAVVLVFTVSTDVWNNDIALESSRGYVPKPHFELDGEGLRLYPVNDAPEPFGEAFAGLRARSWAVESLYAGIIEPLTLRGIRAEQLAVLDEPMGEWERAWRITTLLLQRFAFTTRRLGAEPLLIVAPDACQSYADACRPSGHNTGSSVPQRLLAQIASAAGLEMVDLLPAFRARAAAQRLYIPGDVHWSAAGHALAAEVMAPSVRSLLAKGRRRERSRPRGASCSRRPGGPMRLRPRATSGPCSSRSSISQSSARAP